MKKILSILGIFAAWIFCASDLILSIKGMYGSQFYENFQTISYPKILYGCLSFLAFPFLYMALKEIFSHTPFKKYIFILLFYLSTIPVFIHSSFFYYWHVVREYGMNADILNEFDKLKDLFGTAYFVGLIVVSILLFVVVLLKKTHYPRIFAIFNPICGIILLQISKYIGLFDILYPIFIPATMLAIMTTVYVLYDFGYIKIEVERELL